MDVWPVVRGDTNHHTLDLHLGAMQCLAGLADMQARRLDHPPNVDTHHASPFVYMSIDRLRDATPINGV